MTATPPATALAVRITAATLKALLTRTPFDHPRWEAVCDEHLHLRIGNEHPSIVRTQALVALERFLGRIEGFGCHYCDLWQRREAIYAETDVYFVGRDGRRGEIPCAIVARAARGKLQDLRFHLDPTPIP
jgi:hypothetical protein